MAMVSSNTLLQARCRWTHLSCFSDRAMAKLALAIACFACLFDAPPPSLSCKSWSLPQLFESSRRMSLPCPSVLGVRLSDAMDTMAETMVVISDR